MNRFTVPDPCLDFICLNGGTCIDEQTPEEVNERDIVPHMLNFYCRCLPGFTGHRCESNYVFSLSLANRKNENEKLTNDCTQDSEQIASDYQVTFVSLNAIHC